MMFMDLGRPDAVDGLSRAQGIAPAAPLLAAMALGLREIAARPDVAFSLVRSGRRDAASHGVVGCLTWGDSWFVRIDDDDPFSAVLAQANAFLRDMSPWRMLYNATVAPPSGRIVLNIMKFDDRLVLPDLVAFTRPDALPEPVMASVHDMQVQVFPMMNALQGVVRYRASFFEPTTMDRFGTTMSRALRAMVSDPTAPVRSLC
jgi:hypothetical protein